MPAPSELGCRQEGNEQILSMAVEASMRQSRSSNRMMLPCWTQGQEAGELCVRLRRAAAAATAAALLAIEKKARVLRILDLHNL